MTPSLRKAIPVSWRRAGRQGYVWAGRRTAPSRVRPDFILMGGQRCGTTSLFRSLMDHPRVIRPSFHKGVNYFDINYYRGPDWYAGHFPLRATANLRVPAGTHPVAFEASGYYMFHPCAIERLARDLPDVQLVAMLRDPVERAYSAWKHETQRGFEWEDFQTALELEDERQTGEADRMAADVTYQSFCHRHHAYRRRGEYDTLLTSILKRFPRKQIHLMYSEDFFARPAEEFRKLSDFLELEPVSCIRFDQYNARASREMPFEARSLLTEHFMPRRSDIERLVGGAAPWEWNVTY